MRYHYKKPDLYFSNYGQIYLCDHPVYSKCTLFIVNDKGLAVIQQRFDPDTKSTTWSNIDPWLTDDLYLHPGFKIFFDNNAGISINGLFPTVTIRQIMWKLKMKPLKKMRWETVFDRKNV